MATTHRSIHHIVAELSQRDLLELAARIAEKHDIVIDELAARTAIGREARYAFWRELVENHSFSYPRVGALFGVHHTTVLYGVRIAQGLPGKGPLCATRMRTEKLRCVADAAKAVA